MATTNQRRTRSLLGRLNDVSVSGAAQGDMLYLNDSGLWVIIDGSKTEGRVPTIQGDGSVAWATPSGGSNVIGDGSGATVVGTGVDSDTTSPLSITVPAGIQENDLCVYAVQTVNSVPDADGPEGDGSWNEILYFDTNSNEYHAAWWKVAGASEPATWDLTHSSGDQVAAAAVVYRGVDSLWSSVYNIDTLQCGWTPGHPEGLQVVVWLRLEGDDLDIPTTDDLVKDIFEKGSTGFNPQVLIAHRDTVSAIDGFPFRAFGVDTQYTGALNNVFYLE